MTGVIALPTRTMLFRLLNRDLRPFHAFFRSATRCTSRAFRALQTNLAIPCFPFADQMYFMRDATSSNT